MGVKQNEILGIANMKRWQLVLVALLMTGLSYYSASRAIDTGSWWQYLMAFVGLYLAYRAIRLTIRHDDKE